MGGATGVLGNIVPLTFGTRGSTGNTMKMIFPVINLCFYIRQSFGVFLGLLTNSLQATEFQLP